MPVILFHLALIGPPWTTEKTPMVTLCPQDYWEHNKCCIDTETDEMYEVVETLGLYELTEATYEPESGTTIEDLRKMLLGAGCVESPEFSAFLDSHVTADE